MHVVAYALALSLLALIAIERAQRSGHILPRRTLAAFGAVGAAGTCICSLEGVASPALIIAFACVAVCAVTDASTGLIYNSVIGASLIGITGASLSHPLLSLEGAGTGYTLAYLLHAVTRGRGMGFGDVKLFAIVGAALGAVAALGCFGAAFVLGAAVSIVLLIAARIDRSSTVPFAPYLALATMFIGCMRMGIA